MNPTHCWTPTEVSAALAGKPADPLADLHAACQLADTRVLLAAADEYDRMFEAVCRLIGSWPRADIVAPPTDLRPEAGTWEPAKPPWVLWLFTFAVTAAAYVWARLQLPETP